MTIQYNGPPKSCPFNSSVVSAIMQWSSYPKHAILTQGVSLGLCGSPISTSLSVIHRLDQLLTFHTAAIYFSGENTPFSFAVSPISGSLTLVFNWHKVCTPPSWSYLTFPTKFRQVRRLWGQKYGRYDVLLYCGKASIGGAFPTTARISNAV